MTPEKIKPVVICDRIALFSVCAIAFFLPISKGIIEALSISAVLCFLIKRLIMRDWRIKTPVAFGVFAYVLVCFISIFISSNLQLSARTFCCKILQDTLFFLAVVDTLNNERRIRSFLYILFASSLLLGIDGVYQYFTHKDFIRNRKYFGIPRIHATFATANDFGCYLTAVIPFTLVAFFTKFRRRLLMIVFIFLFLLLFTCLMLTVSRGAWFAFLGSILFMSVWLRTLGISFLAVALIIVLILSFCHPYIKQRLNDLAVSLNNIGIDRQMTWRAAWDMFMSRPWLGLGIGTFMFNFKRFVAADYPYGISYAHNCYLQMLSEIGVIGLMAFLSIIVLFFYCGVTALNGKNRVFAWYILLASLAAILGYCIQMGVDTIFYSLDLGILFWLILGIGASAAELTRQAQTQETSVKK